MTGFLGTDVLRKCALPVRTNRDGGFIGVFETILGRSAWRRYFGHGCSAEFGLSNLCMCNMVGTEECSSTLFGAETYSAVCMGGVVRIDPENS